MFNRRMRDKDTGPTTYVAQSTTISGNIVGKGTYVFCGEVEGDCDVDGLVTLAEEGRWRGTLCANDVIVAGTVEGDVMGRHKVEVGSTGRILGTLAGGAVAVAEGAIVEGEIKVTSGDTPVRFVEKRKT